MIVPLVVFPRPTLAPSTNRRTYFVHNSSVLCSTPPDNCSSILSAFPEAPYIYLFFLSLFIPSSPAIETWRDLKAWGGQRVLALPVWWLTLVSVSKTRGLWRSFGLPKLSVLVWLLQKAVVMLLPCNVQWGDGLADEKNMKLKKADNLSVRLLLKEAINPNAPLLLKFLPHQKTLFIVHLLLIRGKWITPFYSFEFPRKNHQNTLSSLILHTYFWEPNMEYAILKGLFVMSATITYLTVLNL